MLSAMSDYASTAQSELMTLAREKEFDEVVARFRDFPPDEVLAVADWLREEDIYNVAIELYRWLLELQETPDAHFGIGQCYGKIYDYDRALTHLDRVPIDAVSASRPARSSWRVRRSNFARRG